METSTKPNPKEILEGIAKSPSIYGMIAKEHLSDEEKIPAVLAEIYDEYKNFPENCVDAFGYKTTFQLFAMFKDSSILL